MNDFSAQLATELQPASGTGPDWLNALRQAAAEQFRSHGLPTRKDEAWKYTGLGVLTQNEIRLSVPADTIIAPAASPAVARPVVAVEQQVTLLNGRILNRSENLPSGVALLALDEALDTEVDGLQALLESLPSAKKKTLSSTGFSALNTATLENGVVIRVASGVDGGRVLLSWSTSVEKAACLFNSRVCLILEPGAKLELLEQFETPRDNKNTSNIVVQAALGEGAALRHVRLQQESETTGLITRTEVSQQAGSDYRYYGFDFGGGLVRHDLHCMLLGSAAKASLNGAYLLDGNRHVDNHARVDHMAPDGFSEQYFRGVAGGSGKAVFNTAVYVHPGADGTEAKQSNANILLSKRAEIDTKPELEIYADEVVASHGATVGQLDEQAVFYLRSRGLNQEQARQILTTAFCRSVSDRLADPQLAEAISERMMDVMPQLD